MKKLLLTALLLIFSLLTFSRNSLSQNPFAEDFHKPVITYDKFQNVTWYESGSFSLTDYNSFVMMKIMFACKGNSGNNPCRATQFLVEFSYSTTYSNTYPFSYQNKNVIVLANNKRLPLGAMNITYNSNIRSYSGILYISFAQLKQIVMAKNIEFLVGGLASQPFTLENLNTLGRFYTIVRQSYPQTKESYNRTRDQQAFVELAEKLITVDDYSNIVITSSPSIEAIEKIKVAITKLDIAISIAKSSQDIEGEVYKTSSDAISAIKELTDEPPIRYNTMIPSNSPNFKDSSLPIKGKLGALLRASKNALEASLNIQLLSIPTSKLSKDLEYSTEKANLEQNIINTYNLYNIGKSERPKRLLAFASYYLPLLKEQ